jgi:hypothetical protein
VYVHRLPLGTVIHASEDTCAVSHMFLIFTHVRLIQKVYANAIVLNANMYNNPQKTALFGYF